MLAPLPLEEESARKVNDAIESAMEKTSTDEGDTPWRLAKRARRAAAVGPDGALRGPALEKACTWPHAKSIHA